MERQLMKVSFGYPEVLHLTGVALIIAGNVVAGWVFCAIGLLGVAFRFGIYAQEQEKRKNESDKTLSKLTESAKELLTVLSKISSNDTNGYH